MGELPADDTLPFQPHSDTSREAAENLPDAATLRRAVYDALLAHGPMTDEQLQERLVMNPSTERPRRVELVGLGLVVESGLRARTRANRWAVRWKVADPSAPRPEVAKSMKEKVAELEARVRSLEAENEKLRAERPRQSELFIGTAPWATGIGGRMP